MEIVNVKREFTSELVISAKP